MERKRWGAEGSSRSAQPDSSKKHASGEAGFQHAASGTSQIFSGCTVKYFDQEIVMKSIAKAFVIGSLLVATQAAWSSPLGWGSTDSGSIIPTQSTYAEEHGASQATASFDFPVGAEELSRRTEPPVRN